MFILIHSVCILTVQVSNVFQRVAVGGKMDQKRDQKRAKRRRVQRVARGSSRPVVQVPVRKEREGSSGVVLGGNFE